MLYLDTMQNEVSNSMNMQLVWILVGFLHCLVENIAGCCYGKKLSALILPSKEIVQVQAHQVYAIPDG